MLQVGYGDITPATALEEMTAVFLMLIGAENLATSHLLVSEAYCMRAWLSQPKHLLLQSERACLSSIATEEYRCPAGIIFFGFVISSSQ